MSTSQAVATARRLAKIRDSIAERARAELARHDAKVRESEAAVAEILSQRRQIDRTLRPAEGEALDARAQTIGRYAALNLERAMERTRSDLSQRRQQRDAQRQVVRKLSTEAERAQELHRTLKESRAGELARRETKLTDAAAAQRALRAGPRLSSLPPPPRA